MTRAYLAELLFAVLVAIGSGSPGATGLVDEKDEYLKVRTAEST